MKVYEYSQFGLNNLSLVERDEPRPRAREVLVKFHAASLNYRDVLKQRRAARARPRDARAGSGE